ncbi:unnamed protein product [Strongylus vulgaris]|uniref:WASH complex subunit 4 N-terminal domain-containing protein n=1 Tax=Strongylus vulgaris TaxID=40348 RepID=A0A3P7IY36_STRVU|nr:unnamed protein product [Strongylus vulgaris]
MRMMKAQSDLWETERKWVLNEEETEKIGRVGEFLQDHLLNVLGIYNWLFSLLKMEIVMFEDHLLNVLGIYNWLFSLLKMEIVMFEGLEVSPLLSSLHLTVALDLGAIRSVDSLTCCDDPTVDKCCSTLATILSEVSEIRNDASEKKNVLPGAFECKLFRAWSGLGELLAILLQTDKIIESRPAIKNDWNIYCRAMGTAQHNPAQFGVTADALRSLITAIATVEAQVMAGNGLRNCYEQSYGEIDDDKQFASRMRSVIIEMYNQWEKAADGDVPDKHRLMVIVSLFVFFHLHFPTKDTKLPKLIWKSHRKIVAFHLVGDILWIPCEFLMREMPSIVNAVDKKSVRFIQHLRETFYVEHCDGMLEEAVSQIAAAEDWRLKVCGLT